MTSTRIPPRWPSVGHERLAWAVADDPSAGSRRQRRAHQGPYLAAVVPPIAGIDLVLPGDLLAQAADASAELARFDGEMGGEIGHFSAILLRTESAASSRIENLTASARAVAEAEIADPLAVPAGGRAGGRNAAEIVANTRAMTAALALSERVDAASILAMHHALMAASEPDHAGRFRSEQVWIGGGHAGPHQADFVPPAHPRVAAAIADLVAFVARDDLPALIHAAVAHAQFETIHPFTDGNGRTGRALIQTMLRRAALTRNVTVPVSAGLLADPEAYFAALTRYRAGDPGPIVAQLADASLRAIGNGRLLVDELRAIRERWRAGVVARRDSASWRLADLLLRRPVVNARLAAAELGVAVGNVHRLVAPLLAAGVLLESSDARRNQSWRAPDVLAALDAFATRARRRSPR